ncbi:hypothetical protein [Scatolibacter rhodanostii]|uniref:hypothetical protein n=1 Tax=Scatolibacter rhodanostii TaxID=2014781 RepID=UPI000C08AA7B|nr:hypothetical protein [Scatolibacter rhodanostii]
MVWYQKRWVIILSSIVFFPLGFFLIKKKYPGLKKWKNISLYVLLSFWTLIFIAAIFGKPPKPESIEIDSNIVSFDLNTSKEVTFTVSPASAKINEGELSFLVSPNNLLAVKDLSDYENKEYRLAIQSQTAEGNADITIGYGDISSNILEVQVVNTARVEAVSSLEEKIAALSPVTIDKENDIKQVRQLYDSMDSEWKKTVSSVNQLEKAEQEIEARYNQLIEPISAAIKAIGDVTLDSEPTIVKARALYDESDHSIKAKIPNESVTILIEAEKGLNVLKLEAAAAPVVEAINHISIDSQASITQARTTYDALPDKVKQYVTNYENLMTNEQEYQRISEEKAAATEAAAQEERAAAEAAAQEQESAAVGQTVYWVSSGEVYHSTKDCPSLGRSKNIYSGSIGASGKSRPCKNCYH